MVVSTGTYAEEVEPPKAGLIYEANGAVVVDGETSRRGFDVTVANTTIIGFEFVNCTEGVHFRSGGNNGLVEDCESSVSTGRGFYANGATGCVFRRCYSHDHTSGYGFEFEGGADDGLCEDCWSTSSHHAFICKTSTNVTFRRCVAFETTLSGFYSKAGNGMHVLNCIAYDTNYGAYITDDSGSPPNSSNAEIKNSIFQTQVRGIYAVAEADTTGLDSDYNDFWDCDFVGVIDSTTYAALADWQGQGYDAHSYAIDPEFVTTVQGGFKLPADSPLLGVGENGADLGLGS